jgi:hypothetical protein
MSEATAMIGIGLCFGTGTQATRIVEIDTGITLRLLPDARHRWLVMRRISGFVS